ncbi:MAG TPA: VWA domain-containing protein [Acidobacteriaceae bacterium]|nr:VWA domain-containing protein [Acidobacteriaceae bacterium]
MLILASCAFAQNTQAPAPIEEAPPMTVIRVHTRLVNVFVNVSDASDTSIGMLNKEDFQVFEDKKPQRVAVFEKQLETPLSVVMAIDTSGSMIKDARLVREAARQFVKDVIRPQDEMEVLQFAEDVREIVPFTSDAKRIDEGLGQLSEGTDTNLYDAIYLAGQNLGQRKPAGDGIRKRIVVVISDGGDSGKGTGYEQAVEQALRGEAMVYSIIVVPIVADAGRNTGGEHALIQMAEDTGGKYYYAESPQELKTAFAHISDDLRTQYLLGYYAPEHKPGTNFHAITVQLTDPAKRADDVLRYRSGYYAR